MATALGDSKTNGPLDQNHPINHNDLRSEIKLQDRWFTAKGSANRIAPISTGIECYTKLIPLANRTPLCYTIKFITPSTQGTSDVTKLKHCHNNQQTCLQHKCYWLEDNFAVYGVLIPLKNLYRVFTDAVSCSLSEATYIIGLIHAINNLTI